MPQRTLFYRFLNTIIDDLFSFIITMPTMHRISCFRDDFVFVIYLYQRYTYNVDKTRGLYATEEKTATAVTDTAKVATTEESDASQTARTTASTSDEVVDESKKDR